MEEFGQVLSYVATAAVGAVTAYFARKKAKEDNNLSAISHAVQVWQKIAENNAAQAETTQKHWDNCEKETKQLREEVSALRIQLLESNTKITLLELKIERLTND